MPQLNTSSVNSQADNLGTDFATAAVIIYDGSVPADANTAITSQTALATHTLTSFGASAAGVITAATVPDTVTIDNPGTATFARLVLTTKTMQVTVGVGTGELQLSSLTYVAGEDSTLNSLTITQPAS